MPGQPRVAPSMSRAGCVSGIAKLKSILLWSLLHVGGTAAPRAEAMRGAAKVTCIRRQCLHYQDNRTKHLHRRCLQQDFTQRARRARLLASDFRLITSNQNSLRPPCSPPSAKAVCLHSWANSCSCQALGGHATLPGASAAVESLASSPLGHLMTSTSGLLHALPSLAWSALTGPSRGW